MRTKTRKLIVRCLWTIFVALLSLIIIVPLMIMVLGSFKSPAEAQRFNLALPSEWLFSNYTHVIENGGIARAFINSSVITVAVTLLVLIFGCMCAFVVSRRPNRYTQGVYLLFLMGMVSPIQIITTFGLLKMLNLMGTFFGVIMIITALQMPWTIFVLTGFIKTVPRALDEAAFIDGAKPLRMFFQVILPLLRPILATATVTTAMGAWNEFMVPLYFFNTASRWTMPLTVYNFFGQYASNWNYVFADLMLTALPIALLYLFCQKYVVSGMTAGSVKG